MSQLSLYSALLETVYDGAVNAAAWPRILASAARWMGVEKTLLLTPWLTPEKGGFVYTHGITQEQIELWQSRYQPEDLRARRIMDLGLLRQGNVILGHELVPARELLASRWWRDFLSRIDLFHSITGIVHARNASVPPATVFNCYRGVKARPFDERHRRKLKLLLPHLSRSLGLMFRLRDVEFRVAASLHALDRVQAGVLLLNEQGHVSFVNSVAERMLRKQDGLRLAKGPDTSLDLQAQTSVARAAIRRAMHDATRIDAGKVSHLSQVVHVPRPSGLADYAVQVSHLPASNPYRVGPVEACAIAFISDGESSREACMKLLADAYRLTRAEASVALALRDGGSLKSITPKLGIATNTIKTHLKNIYAKMAVNNRAALTRALLSLGCG